MTCAVQHGKNCHPPASAPPRSSACNVAAAGMPQQHKMILSGRLRSLRSLLSLQVQGVDRHLELFRALRMPASQIAASRREDAATSVSAHYNTQFVATIPLQTRNQGGGRGCLGKGGRRVVFDSGRDGKLIGWARSQSVLKGFQHRVSQT